MEFEYCDFCNPDHLDSLAGMVNHLLADPMTSGEQLSKIKQLRLVDGLANHPTAEVLFAIEGQEVVGMVIGFVNFSITRVASCLLITDFFVLNRFRAMGYGRALLHRVVESAVERNFCHVSVCVSPAHSVARKILCTVGFVESEPGTGLWIKCLN